MPFDYYIYRVKITYHKGDRTLIISNLKSIYSQMKINKLERYIFEYEFNNIIFQCLYFLDESPHLLGFGVAKYNFYFEIEVKHGFQINPKLNESDYIQLCKILKLKYDPNNPFKPSIFFEEFNKALPSVVHTYTTPTPQAIAIHRRDVEEADKIYFKGWKDHSKTGNKVSQKNLEKTKKLLSNRAYELCKKKNISSCWTDKLEFAKKYKDPNAD